MARFFVAHGVYTMCVCVFNCESPISMKVTLRLLNEGANLTLAQDLKTEFRLCQRFVRDSDFYEGVRAGTDTIIVLLLPLLYFSI